MDDISEQSQSGALRWLAVAALAIVIVLSAAVWRAAGGVETVPAADAPATELPAVPSAGGGELQLAPQSPPTVLAGGSITGSPLAPQSVEPQGALLPPPSAAAPTLRPDAPAPPAVSARAAVIVDEASAAILVERDAQVPLPPASLTKIATAIVVIDRLPLENWVETDVDSREMRGSSVMGLQPGDWFTARDLLFGLMLPSGNDAALALARATSGNDAAFVAEMNRMVRSLGLRSTNFTNPHGLSNRNHLSSAYDMAMLARYAMSMPTFRNVVATRGTWANGTRDIWLNNGNSFNAKYPGADGVKIGYTRSAGNTLVASATRNGRRLYAVVLNSVDRDADAAALLDWAFANYTWPE